MRNQKNKRQNFRVCSGNHNLGSTQGPEGLFATCFKVLNGKYLHAEVNNKKFSTQEELRDYLAWHGYGEEYFSRKSVPEPVFADLKHVQEQCLFDAKYRYYKWLEKQMDKNKGNSNSLYLFWKEWNSIYEKLKKLGEKVGCFHPCSNLFNTNDYPKQVVFFICKCGAKFKRIFPYKGAARCPECETLCDAGVESVK